MSGLARNLLGNKLTYICRSENYETNIVWMRCQTNGIPSSIVIFLFSRELALSIHKQALATIIVVLSLAACQSADKKTETAPTVASVIGGRCDDLPPMQRDDALDATLIGQGLITSTMTEDEKRSVRRSYLTRLSSAHKRCSGRM